MNLRVFINRILLAVLILAALYSLGWSLSKSATVMRALAFACLIGYLVNPVVRHLERRGLSRTMAIAAVFLAFFTVLIVGVYLLVPIVQRQTVLIVDQAQIFLASRDQHLERLTVILNEKLPADFAQNIDLERTFTDKLGEYSRWALGILASIASNLIYLFLIPLMVFLILQDGPSFHKRLIATVPNRYFEVVYRLIRRIDDQLGGYIRGVLIVTFCVGAVGTAGLWLCDMRYFFVIGPLMGLLNMIPIFGPLIGMLIAAIAMLFQTGDPTAVVGPILVGVVAQVLDNVAFTPIAVSRSVALHPLAVLVMTLIGGQVFGLPGLLLAVPFTATAKVILQAVREARQSQRLAAPAPKPG